MKLTILTVVVLAAALALAACAKVSAAEPPQAGQPAPDFTLASQDGSPVSLHDFRGHWVVLYFYPKDGTPGCTIEAHNFERDLAKYEKSNTVIVGVSVDSTGSHKEFCAKQGLTFKLLADTDKKVSARYGSLMNLVALKIAKRNTFLIDPQGRIAKVWTGVDPAPHSAQVLEALAGFEARQS
ncbi:MAG TPA: peroxiredoxin [Bryobacteraceae bacterium]|nr:peroxiredoxin [Bryobacteraceae bacterium]